jgi:hypothetical protein
MSQKGVRAPSLPVAPTEYDPRYIDQLLGILRLYFNQLDNAGPMTASTERVSGDIVSGLSFAQPDSSNPTTFIISLPTQADLANLRAGDVYYDTTASNVLKVKV